MLTSMYGGKTRLLKQLISSLICAAVLTLSPGAQAASDKPAYPRSVIPDADSPARPDSKGGKNGLSMKEVDSVADRNKILTELYTFLRKAEDAPSAALVAKAIEKFWLRSGSATVDLLMRRVGQLPERNQNFSIALICAAVLTLSPGAQAASDKPAYPRSVIPDADSPARPDSKGGKNGLSMKEVDSVADRNKILTELYTFLRKAEDAPSAALVAKAIEKFWLRSGSATVDLLMSRVGQLMGEENFDVALNLLNSVVEIAPGYSEGWNRRAALYFVKKDFARSLDDLRHVLAIDPLHFKAIQGLGMLMQELGDKKAALQAFRHALDVYPQLEDVRQFEKELAREVEGQGI